MKAIMINQYKNKKILKKTKITLPKLSKHQILIKKYTTSINPIN